MSLSLKPPGIEWRSTLMEKFACLVYCAERSGVGHLFRVFQHDVCGETRKAPVDVTSHCTGSKFPMTIVHAGGIATAIGERRT